MKKVAICFGGYCPLHQGHMDVIMRAKKENDYCIVIVCGYDNEPRGWEINLNLEERYNLIHDFFTPFYFSNSSCFTMHSGQFELLFSPAVRVL